MLSRTLPILFFASAITLFAQVATNPFAATPGSDMPPIEPGVSLDLAKWRAAHYSDVRYKLNLTLEKMSPMLRGTIEVRVRVSGGAKSEPGAVATGYLPPIIMDWRKIKGHEDKSTISNVLINGQAVTQENHPVGETPTPLLRKEGSPDGPVTFSEYNEHLIFRDGVVAGENVIKLDFTSPILTSGSAITRYIDKEDGSEYIYSLFVPSDASTAFPVFDQPDLKARFELTVKRPKDWLVISNALSEDTETAFSDNRPREYISAMVETRRISTYVFAFAAGPFERFWVPEDPKVAINPQLKEAYQKWISKDISVLLSGEDAAQIEREKKEKLFRGFAPDSKYFQHVYVRKSQAAKFQPHAAEVFRLNREAIRFFEEYFDYKFPFPKYDLVLIPEFPFGGMEHAGATFLRESAIIFPQEPTKNDHISRATLIFHEAAHQWFGDTVTMKWFDDLWLKEGFATFTAYKAMERIMPEMNAWKVFYERVKQAAYQTDSTKGTTPIYQEIKNLSAAKSAYGNIVYNKAPAFLRQAEFYLGEDKFQTAVRAFLKKHEFGNAGWEDLVKEFSSASNSNLTEWARTWVKQSSLPTFRLCVLDYSRSVKLTGRPAEIIHLFSQTGFPCYPTNRRSNAPIWPEALQFYYVLANGKTRVEKVTLGMNDREIEEIWGYNFGGRESKRTKEELAAPKFIHTNYGDHGYGIFLLDDKSREYVLKNIQNEKDPFLRSMMWGALWDSVREGELDPREYVELVVKVMGSSLKAENHPVAPLNAGATPLLRKEGSEEGEDESTIASLLGRTGTALNYYLSEPGAVATGLTAADGVKRPIATAQGSDRNDLRARVVDLLIERMRTAPSLGQRITYYRAFLNVAGSENSRSVLKRMLATGGNLSGSEGAPNNPGGQKGTLPTGRVSAFVPNIPLKTKDKFDIVTRLLILGDRDAVGLLAELEKTETSDDAKRYAYAARAGFATAENKAKYWNDFVNNKEISESWIEAAFGPWNSIRHSELTLPYLERSLKELPNHKRSRKIFFVNGWLGAFIGGQRSEEALAIVNKFLADNPNLDKDLRLKILENADLIERAVRIRAKYSQNRLR
ncbi:MAG: M1 family aminopeptidase [Blastocatellia bacterium]